MKRFAILGMTALALACLVTLTRGEDDVHHTHATAFDLSPITSLAGTWQGTSTHGGEAEQATVEYAVTSGGSAVVETLFVGSDHEMVSVFFKDGDTLAFTHYCMLGNQPTMRAQPPDADGTIRFVYTGGTNIPDITVPHMREVSYRLDGPDHLLTTWTFYADGKPGDTVTLDLHRAAP